MSAAGSDILERILARKRQEVAEASARVPLDELARAAAARPPVRSLRTALQRPAGAPVRVLAEIKRASPSAGAIAAGADPAAVAKDYAAHGAAAISVLTDRDFFDGELAFLDRCRPLVRVPLLRKDFLIDRYQVIEARAAGADAVLLIAAALGPRGLAELGAEVAAAGLEALVEVHDAQEARWAVDAGAAIIGVNHRNLRTFQIDMSLTGALAPSLPAGTVLVAESGIRTGRDVAALGAAGAHAVLVGEAFMRTSSPGRALAELVAEAASAGAG